MRIYKAKHAMKESFGIYFEGHTSSITCLGLSSDNMHLITGSCDKYIRVWDLLSKTQVLSILGHAEEINSVCISLDNQLIVSGSTDTTVKIWNLNNLVLSSTICLEGHKGKVTSVAITSDNRYVASSAAFKVYVWRLNDRVLVMLLVHPENINSLVLTKDNKYLISASNDSTLKVWSFSSEIEQKTEKVKEKKHEIASMEGHSKRVTCVAAACDSSILVSGSDDMTVIVWDLRSFKQVAILSGHCDWVNDVAITANNKFVCSGAWDKTIRVWSLLTHLQVLNLQAHDAPITGLAFTSDDQHILSCSVDRKIKQWGFSQSSSSSQGEVKAFTFPGHGAVVTGLVFSEDCKYCMSLDCEYIQHLWDVNLNKELAVIQRQFTAVEYLIVCDNENYFACIDSINFFHVWRVERNSLCVEVEKQNGFKKLAITRSKRFIIAQSKSNIISVWNFT